MSIKKVLIGPYESGIYVEVWYDEQGNCTRRNFPAELKMKGIEFGIELSDFFDVELHVDPHLALGTTHFLPEPDPAKPN
jgi:hypothetical protein